MQDLSNRICRYYLDHFDELPFEKQFHFASRLYLWDQDPWARQKLDKLKGVFTANDQPQEALAAVIQASMESAAHGSKNAAELRRPYFEKYPLLKPYVGALFRITFLKHAYDLDVRQAFFEHFPEAEVETFSRQLLADSKALAVLSTHAVNFLYLYSRVIKPDDKLFEPEQFLEIGRHYYDSDDLLHLQLQIYLYTHCIIGESQFYYRTMPANLVYKKMFEELEKLIEAHFVDINLDNKFEFLVCTRQLGYDSRLEQKIYDEAAGSLAPNGIFLVDRHNNNPQVKNSELDTSEHRNILFILSGRKYKPLDKA